MKSVNLLPADSRGPPERRPQGRGRPRGARGTGAFVLLGALALCVAAFAAYVLTANTVEERQAELAAAPSRRRPSPSAPLSSSPTPTSSRSPRLASRPSASSPTRASTGSRRCATSPGPSPPTSRYRDRRLELERRRRRLPAAQRDRGPGHRADGLHARPDAGRHDAPRCARSRASPASRSPSPAKPEPPDRRGRRRRRAGTGQPPAARAARPASSSSSSSRAPRCRAPCRTHGPAGRRRRPRRRDRRPAPPTTETPTPDARRDHAARRSGDADPATPALDPAGRRSPVTRSNKILLTVVALASSSPPSGSSSSRPSARRSRPLDAEIATKPAEVAQALQRSPRTSGARQLQDELRLARPARQGRAGRRRRALADRPDRHGRRQRRRLPHDRARPTSAAPSSTADARSGRARRGRARAGPGDGPGRGGALSAMPFTFEFTGEFFDLSSFLARLERFVTVSNKRRRDGPPAADRERADRAVERRLPGHAGGGRRRHLRGAAGRAGHGRRVRADLGAAATTAPSTPRDPTTTATAGAAQ